MCLWLLVVFLIFEIISNVLLLTMDLFLQLSLIPGKDFQELSREDSLTVAIIEVTKLLNEVLEVCWHFNFGIFHWFFFLLVAFVACEVFFFFNEVQGT